MPHASSGNLLDRFPETTFRFGIMRSRHTGDTARPVNCKPCRFCDKGIKVTDWNPAKLGIWMIDGSFDRWLCHAQCFSERLVGAIPRDQMWSDAPKTPPHYLRIGEEAYCPSDGRSKWRRTGPSPERPSTLEPLQQAGMVNSAMGAPTPERGGRAKRLFSVTLISLSTR